MPRSGVNGTYTLPGAQNTQQPNTSIPSTVNNQGWSDVEQTFNTPQPIVYGGTGGTTAVGGFDGLMVKGADIPTASTLNLDNATGPYVEITGTTTVTAVTLGVKSRYVRNTGIFNIVAGPSLYVNGSASGTFQVAAGSLLYFQGYGSNLVYVWFIGSGITTGTSGSGRWAKYPDGTQECWQTITVAALSMTTAFFGGFRSSGQTWTYPAGFLAGTQPTVTGTVGAGTAFGVVIMDQAADPTASLVYSFVAVSSTAATDPRIVEFHAMGRWY